MIHGSLGPIVSLMNNRDSIFTAAEGLTICFITSTFSSESSDDKIPETPLTRNFVVTDYQMISLQN